MNVLWIFAHPEQRSLNGSLRDEGLRTLHALGHDYRVSDLYAMGWNPVVGSADFGRREHAPKASTNNPHTIKTTGNKKNTGPDDAHAPQPERLLVGAASQRAYRSGMLSADIRAEQEKLSWADAVILQFPLWWYGMPAILKGWFDRVFVKGFAYGVSTPHDPTPAPGAAPASGRRRTLRYGEGALAGKRAMVIVSAGAGEPSLGPRGINGDLCDLLFPLHHGTLWYTGMSVLPPLAVYDADRVSPEAYEKAATQLRERLGTLPTAAPLPFRHQNGTPDTRGDYDADLVLHPDVAPDEAGLTAHYHRDRAASTHESPLRRAISEP
ncbi:NAD(P)H-dependent oxidoreductase [Streptomyces zagrosensis]|uniref:NAD(P)H dehydrogenase (Quinone) n=1 Tax=Streptomyces zagrosensis TaxID=1042984 RepID=A0A7W9UXZ8_9ACTN|nr:NAD(P)H-dependent oxidoreductase [Streptomyces zagrosensis]MBB5934274.1 NAD(P)H dehydrogenase (quinone) [Streptomyces zagrosensis]